MEEKILLDEFAKRLTSLVEEYSNIPFLMEKLGLKSKSTIYRYMNAEMTPKLTTVKAIADIYNVNPVWLMGWDVEKKIQNLTPANASKRIFVYGLIPAGIPIECIEDILDTEEIPIDMLRGGKEFFGLRVKGDSMSPDYLDADTLIVQRQDDCESGDDCIVMVNGNDGTFKRVFKTEQGIVLQPLNPSYSPMVYTNEQIKELPVRIIGKVVELRRKTKRK